MDITDLLHAAEEAIADAEQRRAGRREPVLWLADAPTLTLGRRRPIKAKASRTGPSGRTEWGYTARQARRIMARLLGAFRDHARDTGATP